MSKNGTSVEDSISPWVERGGVSVCRNCGNVEGTGHHPTCIEAPQRSHTVSTPYTDGSESFCRITGVRQNRCPRTLCQCAAEDVAREQPCVRGNGWCPVGCCSHLTDDKEASHTV